MTKQHTDHPTQTSVPAGFVLDSKGNLIHESNISESEKLKDQTVTKILEYGTDLHAQITRFKQHCMDDIDTLQDILADKYNAKMGGAKGNLSIISFDGLSKVSVQNASLLEFGPELQVAKCLFDEILNELGANIDPGIKAILMTAFQVNKQGKIDRENLFRVKKLTIDHPKWTDFQDAVNDSIRIASSKTYIRIHTRPTTDHAWQAVSIDMAKV